MAADEDSWITTHDWSQPVDGDHLRLIRSRPGLYAPGGVLHLVLEVVAYADDEARELGRRGRCEIVLFPDGSVSVADDGRGTDTRMTTDGRIVRKPVMATRDLRFFDSREPQLLPDGQPRRGISVVAALSEWLVHTNHRADGSWQQRYRAGVPLDGLTSVASDGRGTTVRFLARDLAPVGRDDLTPATRFEWLDVSCRIA
ncbi:MAG: hypothetical protein AAGC63_13985 [Propionicimonas sp.]|nr:hypothetical protein [Propionicimonas sp.]